jgi:hypothetical protein
VYTHDTAGTGSGMSWYAKIQYRTCTRVTRFGSTTGLPIPVRNPTCCHHGHSRGCGSLAFVPTSHLYWLRLISTCLCMFALDCTCNCPLLSAAALMYLQCIYGQKPREHSRDDLKVRSSGKPFLLWRDVGNRRCEVIGKWINGLYNG